MSRKVTKIPQTKKYIPIEDQRLQVAAYCRVSTHHEEQQHSLAAQTSTIQTTFETIPIGYWLLCILTLHPVLVLISAPAIKSSSETVPKEK